MVEVSYTVVGGGICGLLTALKLKQAHPTLDIVVVEKEPYVGHHSTTRNSGVLHAGLYYKTGSLKHTLCLSGYQQWMTLAQELQIPMRICGKFVIASNESEHKDLDQVFENAQRNGVQGLRKIENEELNEIRAFTHASAGFFSPLTGILDISKAINSIRDEFVRLGGILLTNTLMRDVRFADYGFAVKTSSDSFKTRHLINCAGAGAVHLREILGLTGVENVFVKGNYLKIKKPYYNKRLIYPVPPKDRQGLGVHTSFHMDGLVRFGPNTEPVEFIDYISLPQNIDLMYPAIAERFKGIEKSDLSLDYVGVRTKIRSQGQLYPDFLVQGPNETKLPGYAEMLGIESPGLTAAPALADLIIEKLKS